MNLSHLYRGSKRYLDLYRLGQKGVDAVMRKHQRRTKNSALIQTLGKGDRLVDWIKMRPSPQGLTKAQWAQIPQTLRVREISFVVDIEGFRSRSITVVTTLLDSKQFPKEAFEALYFKRWKVELFFKDIKISMGMDILRCKSPQMIQKEIWMFVMAYNLIRALILQAAQTHHTDLYRLSFKGTLSTLRQWVPLLASPSLSTKQRKELTQTLFTCLAYDTIPLRPHRFEPRAKKRRGKNFQLLTQPRFTFKECMHRSKYKKNP